MTLYKVWCEFDMGWNVNDNEGVYSNKEELIKKLEAMDWSYCDDFKNYQEVLESGLLDIKTIEG